MNLYLDDNSIRGSLVGALRKDRDVVRAIANLEAASLPIANEHHILNHWR
jgi:hypothetical protein